MDSETEENYEYMYDDVDSSKHEKLVDKVLNLHKTQNLKKPSRTEPTLKVSEFDLVKSITGEKGSINIEQLTKPLKDQRSRVKIKEKVKKAEKIASTLPKPLEKPQADRIRRGIAYEKARLELDRWEATITSNRASTDLHFPLDNDYKVGVKEAVDFPSMWQLKSKLEQDLEKIDGKVEVYHPQNDKKADVPAVSLKKMLERRKEAAKLRAFQSYKEAKARRQNKIKSKKFHRIQKREKIKQILKEFEQLQKTNPEEALKKLEEIEKTRALERFTLRHKNTGKWAKSKQILAKYDKESRQVLADQLAINRDLTQKTKIVDSDDEDEMPANNVEDMPIEISDTNKDNSWLVNKEVTDFVSGYKKYWTEKNNGTTVKTPNPPNDVVEQGDETQNDQTTNVENNIAEITNPAAEKSKVLKTKKQRKQPQKKKKVLKNVQQSQSTMEWNVTILNPNVMDSAMEVGLLFDKLEKKRNKKMQKGVTALKKQIIPKNQSAKSPQKPKQKKIDLSMPSQSKKPIIDEELIEQTSQETDQNHSGPSSTTALDNPIKSTVETNKSAKNIDVSKFPKSTTVTNLSTAIPDLITNDEDDEMDQLQIAAEGFEDEDLVDDFSKEKEAEVDKSTPKDLNLVLPGWGSWGGTNIPVSKRKRRRFTVKAPPKMPRRDDNKGTLIINEDAEKKAKEHMVQAVPFPFKSAKSFEAMLRAPIGNTFVPETTFKRNIKPAVTTKIGTIIEPITAPARNPKIQPPIGVPGVHNKK